MKNTLRSFLTYLVFGSHEELQLEEKTMLIALLVSTAVSLLGTYVNYALGLSFLTYLIPPVIALVLMVLFYYIRFKKLYSQLVFPFTFFAFSGLGVVWLLNGGYNGSNTIIMMAVFTLVLIITPLEKSKYLLALFLVLILGLNIYHYNFPQNILGYADETSRFTDIIFSVITSSLAIYFMITFIMKNFRNERAASQASNIKLQSMNKELVSLNDTKDKFFSIIAHDLKNPIANFYQATKLLEDTYDQMSKNEQKELITMVKESSENVLDLLNNLLDWAQSQQKKVHYKPDATNICYLIENNIALFRLSAKNKNISIEFKDMLLNEVYCDYHLINTVLRNLLSNAIKFTPNNGTISIIASPATQSGFAEICIQDSGVGMNPERVQLLFGFNPQDSTFGTNAEKGTGVGLVLCKELVEMNGGKIWAASELGLGSTFTFTLRLFSKDMIQENTFL